jgi:hypothetical protein
MIWQYGVTLLLQPEPFIQEDYTDLIMSALGVVNMLRTQLNIPACLTIAYSDHENQYWRQMMVEHYAAGLRFIDTPTLQEAATLFEYRYLILLDHDQKPMVQNIPVFLQAIEQAQADAVYGMVITEDNNVYNNEPINRGVLNRLISFAMYDAVYLSKMTGYEQLSLLNMVFNGANVAFVPSVFGAVDAPFKFNKLDNNVLDGFEIQPEDIHRYHPKLGAY